MFVCGVQNWFGLSEHVCENSRPTLLERIKVGILLLANNNILRCFTIRRACCGCTECRNTFRVLLAKGNILRGLEMVDFLILESAVKVTQVPSHYNDLQVFTL